MSHSDHYSWTFSEDCDFDTAEYERVRSSLKFAVLDLVDEQGALTYQELAARTGMPPSYAANRLVRYARRNLLSREREQRGDVSTFRLTEHGYRRLEWFRRQ